MGKLAAIELGGTKTILALGRDGHIDERVEFPTTTPQETISRAIATINGWRDIHGIDAIGIASFGPVRVSPTAPDSGTILATPKPGWSWTQVKAPFASAFGCPVKLDTDVNGAALAEHRHGNGRGYASLVYLTIGTGLGGGVLLDGKPAQGLLHPEIGHLALRRAPGDDFAGACIFHQDCAEGLLSGPALAARFDMSLPNVLPTDPRWDFVAHDLAQLFVSLILTVSPERIIVGGGVTLRQPHLLDMAKSRVPAILNGYLPDYTDELLSHLITTPRLGNDAGPVGALILAEQALEEAGG